MRASTFLRRTVIAAVGLGLIGATRAPGAFSTGGYLVVVRADNPAAALPRAALSRLFLKRDNSWPGGLTAAPVDLAEGAEPRQGFSREIHQKPVAAIKAYWQQQIFSGRGTPPPERSTDTQVLEYVRSNPGGVGYVSAEASIGSGVKVLKVEP